MSVILRLPHLQNHIISDRMKGVSKAVSTPLRMSPKEAYAPYVSPFSMARDVPTA